MPLMSFEKMKEIINPENYDGIIVSCYASGTLPKNNLDFIKLFEEYFKTKIGLKVTQAFTGDACSDYENNISFDNLISGYEINELSAQLKL